MKCTYFKFKLNNLKQDLFLKQFIYSIGRVETPADSLFTYSGSYAYNKFHDQKENIHTWMQFVPWYRWDDPNWRFPNRAGFRYKKMKINKKLILNEFN